MKLFRGLSAVVAFLAAAATVVWGQGPQTPNNAAPTTVPIVEGFTSEDITKREISLFTGEPQKIDNWMRQGYGAYQLLSRRENGIGIRERITVPANLFSAWGTSSYRYPIFAWQETMPWTAIRDGMGINWNVPEHLWPQAMKQFKAMGGSLARIDVGWGNIQYDDPTKLKPYIHEHIIKLARYLKSNGVRLLICIDTHPAAPCPIIEGSVTLVKPITEGDKVATIRVRPNSPNEVPRAYRSGFSHVQGYWAAEWMTTSVVNLGDGQYELHFAKEFPGGFNHAAGKELPFAYLKYRPFADDNTLDSQETYNGFRAYASAVLDAIDSAAVPIDFEVCNEYSNWGFLHLRLYTGEPVPSGDTYRIYSETVALIRKQPKYKNMYVIDGFRNQDPWFAQSRQPAGSSAGSNHFYRGPTSVLKHNTDAFGRNAAGINADNTAHVPLVFPQLTYIVSAPETIFSAEVQENVVWGISPYQVQLWGSVQGRGVRPLENPGDINSPVLREPDGSLARSPELVFTEWGDSRWDETDAARYHHIGLFNLRGNIIGFGKGVKRIYWYAAMGPSLGILSQTTDTLPTIEPESVTIMKKFYAAMKGVRINTKRHIECIRIEENHGLKILDGNDTPEFPDLYALDTLYPQMWQLADKRFVATIYVINKDYSKPLPVKPYKITFKNLKHVPGVSKYKYRDLYKRSAATIVPTSFTEDTVTFTVSVGSEPRLLTMNGV